MHEQPTVLTPTQARQGARGKLSLRVLLMSLMLALIVGGLLFAVFYNRTGQATGPSPAATGDSR